MNDNSNKEVNDDLTPIRQEIDDIDQNIQELLVRRADIVKKVSDVKKQHTNAIFYRPEREANVLKKVMSRNCGQIPPKAMAKLFREIMSICLALQKSIEVAFLGPKGTFSQLAVFKHFGDSVEQIACKEVAEIFDKVAKHEIPYGVVPIENSIGGLVETTFNALINTELTICGEVSLEIRQTLLQKNPNTSIKKIYAHQQSFNQCNQWLEQHLPQAEQIAVNSNALAAQYASQEENAAAIAGKQCSELYKLAIIAENIQNHKNNITRFLVIGHNQPESCGDDRTTLLIKVHDAPGALEKLINPFARNGINITLIRSKPASVDLDAYYFFLDLDCYYTNKNFLKAREELETSPMQIKILGSYPKAIL